MATIARTTKAGSSTVDFAASTTALSSEVNTDFNTMYDDYNGNVNSSNIATDGVATANITDLAVTTAKLAANAVTTAKITDDSVTLAKMAVGSVVKSVASAFRGAGYTFGAGSETTIMTLTPIVLESTSVYLFAGAFARVAMPVAGTTFATFRLKEDGNTLFTIQRSFTVSVGENNSILSTCGIFMHHHTTTAASHEYSLTAEQGGAGNSVIGEGTSYLLGIELR